MDCSGEIGQTKQPSEVGDRTHCGLEETRGVCQRYANDELRKREINAAPKKMHQTIVRRGPVISFFLQLFSWESTDNFPMGQQALDRSSRQMAGQILRRKRRTVLINQHHVADCDARIRASAQRFHHSGQKFRRHRIVAGSKMEKLAGRELHAPVKSRINSFSRNLIKAKTRIDGRNRLEELPAGVGGTAVENDRFPIGVNLRRQRIDSRFEICPCI